MKRDGDGWVRCGAGHNHWGLYGAAGLLVVSGGRVLLQHRAFWSHHGNTWGIPGGARGRQESALVATTVEALDGESTALEWVPLGEVLDLPLHPGFAVGWPGHLQALTG